MRKRITKDAFNKKVAAKYGDRFQIISFTGSKSKLVYLDTWYNTVSELSRAADIFKRKVNEKYNFGTSKPLKYTDDEIKEIFKEKVGDEYLIQSKYTGYHKHITVKHMKCGKTYEVTPSDFITKNERCPYCSGRRKTSDDVKETITGITNGEYTLLDDYKTNDTEISVLHKACGHIFKTTENRFVNLGNRCPYCSPIKYGKSYKEKEFSKFIEETLDNKNYEENYRLYISGKHYIGIDLFYKDLNIGFEFDGLYWHSVEKHKEKYNLYKKSKYLEENTNVRVVHIFEDEWANRQEDVKLFIKNEFTDTSVSPTSYKKLSLNYGRKILKHSLSYSKINSKSIIYGFYYNKKLLFVISIVGNTITNVHKLAPCKIDFLDLFKNTDVIHAILDLRFFDLNNNYLIDNEFSVQYINEPKKFFIPAAKNNRYELEKECQEYKYTIYDCGSAQYIKKNK